ncbi:MAG: T9SS type A sorting domain-containing protein, partial [bacterium]
YSIPDSGVNLTGYNNSPFYKSGIWSDSSEVSTGGYNGIANQHFTRTAFMNIPAITDTADFSDTLFLSKSGVSASNDIVLSVTVVNDNSSINREEKDPYSESNEEGTAVVYDMLGRKVMEKRVRGHLSPVLNLKAGVYFIQFNNNLTKRVIVR